MDKVNLKEFISAMDKGTQERCRYIRIWKIGLKQAPKICLFFKNIQSLRGHKN